MFVVSMSVFIVILIKDNISVLVDDTTTGCL